MTPREIADMIKRHEGGPSDVYLDTVGILTLGWGHALHVGSPVPLEVSRIFFENDFNNAVRDVELLLGEYDIYPDPVRKAVLISMAFHLGRAGLLGFKKMWAALMALDYNEAANQILDSKAARQCPKRYIELSKMMRTGERA
ncbi:MAG TPA: lysozyme [Syntrophaceae bacterium]|nr:lysozyme [Syntrophaceae bacterium]